VWLFPARPAYSSGSVENPLSVTSEEGPSVPTSQLCEHMGQGSFPLTAHCCILALRPATALDKYL
jgi:hypothetical protein